MYVYIFVFMIKTSYFVYLYMTEMSRKYEYIILFYYSKK